MIKKVKITDRLAKHVHLVQVGVLAHGEHTTCAHIAATTHRNTAQCCGKTFGAASFL